MAKALRPLSQEQSDVWHLLHDPTTTELFFGGGAGPGKSFLGCLFEASDSIAKPGTRGLIARESYEDLRKTTLLTFLEVLAMLGYREGDHYRYNAQEHTFYWTNGSITFFDHLQRRPGDPEYNRLGSREYTRVFVDEAPDCEAKAIEVLGTRIRFKLAEYGTPGKMLLTGNSGDHWCKEQFVFDKKNESVELPEHRRCVLTTYLSNPDPEFRDIYGSKLEKITDPHTKARLMYGDWLSTPKTGREFFYAFDQQDHVIPHAYDPTKPLHITYDFNSAPYMTLLVAQIVKEQDRHEVRFIKEYCLEHPLSTTEKITQAFAKDLLTGCYAGHNAGLYYYGDYSGKSASTMARDGIRHNYDWVETLLGRWLGNYSCRLFPNPLHDRVRKFLNAIFSGTLPIRVTFHPDMHNTVRDVRQVKEDADGSLLKQMVTDPATKVRYEKNGHCSQAMWYLVTGAFRDTFLEHGKVG